MWHEFHAAGVAADLRQISLTGHRVVRTLLSWDAFMPTASAVDVNRLRDFEHFLDMAAAESLHVVPVLFVHSLGDCVMLPPFAIDVHHPRPGVRVVTGGVAQPGGPRDVYTDPRMIEAALRWVERMLSAFSGHPAIAWWDIGHDPARTVRPMRIQHLRDWAAQMTRPLRESGARCALTLGADDVVTARGVRLRPVVDNVDILGIDIDPLLLPIHESQLSAAPTLFLLQLAQRLSGTDALHVHIGTCERAEEDLDACADAPDAARYAADAVSALSDNGAGGLFAVQWSRTGQRIAMSPPVDLAPRLANRGVVNAAAAHTQFGQSWSREIQREREVHAAFPWPEQLDVDDYYVNLPESFADLFAAWKRERQDHPATLD